MCHQIATDGAPENIAVILLDPGGVLAETIEVMFRKTGGQGAGGGMRLPSIPAKAIAYPCSCDDPMRYSGQLVSRPGLHDELGLGGG